MNKLVAKTYRFTEAAVVAGFTSKQLRYLLHEVPEFALDNDPDRPGGSWRRFSLFDIFRLRLINVLMGYGCEAADAAKIAASVMQRKNLIASYANTPAAMLPATFRTDVLIANRMGDGWDFEIAYPHTFELGAIPDDAVVIKLGTIAQAVFDALVDSDQDATEGE